MGFTAVYMPKLQEGEEPKDKSGFVTEEEAEKYIEQFLCNICLEDLKNGYVSDDEGKRIYDISGIMDTGCGAEWYIIKDEDYEKAETTEDIFMAAGLKKIKGRQDGEVPSSVWNTEYPGKTGYENSNPSPSA